MTPGAQTDHALDLFSGGQESATCLVWASHRYADVGTIGFRCGERQAVETTCREPLRAGLPGLGDPDHIVDLTETIAGPGATAMTPEATIAMTGGCLLDFVAPAPI